MKAADNSNMTVIIFFMLGMQFALLLALRAGIRRNNIAPDLKDRDNAITHQLEPGFFRLLGLSA
jgi:hypothetical protein